MPFEKCPRCELNYILDGGKLCSVCRKEVCGEDIHDDLPEMCSECGENPAVVGGELCLNCLKEITRHTAAAVNEDVLNAEDPTLEISSMGDMEEISLELPEDEIDDEGFEGEDDFDDDDEEDEAAFGAESIEEPLIAEDDYLDEDDYGDGNSSDR